MKLWALLLFAATLASARAQDAEDWEEHLLSDYAFNQRLFEQINRDAESPNKVFHEFPEEPSRRSKRAVVGSNNCDPGYTGTFCESPICENRTEIRTHNTRMTTIDKQLAVECNTPIFIPVDSHVQAFQITVQTEVGGGPVGTLYDSNGKMISHNSDAKKSNYHMYSYRDLVVNNGAGTYMFAPKSGNNENCIVTALGATALVVYGGFVESQFTDKVQETIPNGRLVQRQPIQQINSYFAFTVFNTSYNEPPTFVSFHRFEDVSRQYSPLPVVSRANCNFSSMVGPYVCTDTGSYLLKVRGRDDSGNMWQRVYNFNCDPNGDINDPTPSPEPVIECRNGGTLIKQKDQNVCYCGAHFSGDICQYKICDNGGQLSSIGRCICLEGFSGAFCEHVQCRERAENFKSDKVGISFVVRAKKNDAVLTQIQKAANKIINYFDDDRPGTLESYSLVTVVEGETSVIIANDQERFINAISEKSSEWKETTTCEDKVLSAIEEALSLSTAQTFIKSPIFVFTDATSNDDQSTLAEVVSLLSQYKSPIFTIVYGGGSDSCNPSLSSGGYRVYRYLAQYTHGLVVKTTATGDDISEVALALAQAYYNNNLLGANDLIDSCQYAPEYHLFFVDESVKSINVAGVGDTSVRLRLIDTDEKKIDPSSEIKYGDLTLANFPTLAKGHYRLTIDSGGQTLPCHYRIYAQSRFEAFFGATRDVNEDRSFYQPIYNRDVHLVGLINYVDFPDPENLFAEIVIWKDEDSIQQDRRTVLYASNGIYRDDCAYNLYFGQWKCMDQNGMFYVNLYVTDSSGFTVMRTTTGHCAVSIPSSDPCRNGGVLYKNKCLCTPGWKGDKCQTAVCFNGGTSRGEYCDCVAGWGGPNCHLSRCITQNDHADFERNQITFALIVQKGKDLLSPLIGMNRVVSKVVHNLQSTHQSWVRLYKFWTFDDKEADYIMQSSFPSTMVDAIQVIMEDARAAPYTCKDLLGLEVLIAALKDREASKNMQVFMYVYGGVKYDAKLHRELYELINALDAKIHIVQGNSIRCYDRADDVALTTLVGLATYSGGTFSMSSDGASLLALPLQYKSGNVYDEMREECKGPQTYYFPIDSETQTISLRIIGDLRNEPVITPPGRAAAEPFKVFSSISDRLYVAMRSCPDGWYSVEEQCLRFESANSVNGYKSWDEARQTCMGLGGNLATVSSKAVDDVLKAASAGFDAWIGLNDKQILNRWEWEQGDGGPIPWTRGTSYDGFKPGEPNSGNGKCVAFSKQGWYVRNCDDKLGFVCSTHAYSINYNPGSAKEPHLPRGLWSVQYTTYADDPLPCGLRVDVQSTLQVFRRFDSVPYSDDGYGQALLNYPKNYQMAHVTSMVERGGDRSALEYAHFYPNNNQELAFVARMSPREHCTYEYVSDSYAANQFAYQVAYTGFDSYGYPYQRVIPAVSWDNAVDCQNGGIKAENENRCVCPPTFTGLECTQPVCQRGRLAPNGEACICRNGFAGDFCQSPNCTRGSGEGPPPISNSDQTFTLVLDGSFSGENEKFLRNIDTILDKALGSLKSAEQSWFKNYAAVVTYEVGAPKRVSELVNERNRPDFIAAIKSILAQEYKSETQERNFMRALGKILNGNTVKYGSPVYIVTDSVFSDADKYVESIRNLIAQKHLTISTIILGDSGPPGGRSNYRDESIYPFFDLAFTTGGGFYQVESADKLASFWGPQLLSYYSSIGLTHSIYRKCSDKTDYFQIGDEDTNVIIDIFSTDQENIVVVDPDLTEYQGSTYSQKTKTNILFSMAAKKPGIWKTTVQHTDKVDFCAIAIRAVRPKAPAVGFHQDIMIDKGYHSQASDFAPTSDSMNAIIANSETDTLTYVQVYTHDVDQLVYTSPLIRRTDDCNWNYISQNLFSCPASSFTVAIEGSDPGGHQFRRIYKTHCVNYDKSNPNAKVKPVVIDMMAPEAPSI